MLLTPHSCYSPIWLPLTLQPSSSPALHKPGFAPAPTLLFPPPPLEAPLTLLGSRCSLVSSLSHDFACYQPLGGASCDFVFLVCSGWTCAVIAPEPCPASHQAHRVQRRPWFRAMLARRGPAAHQALSGHIEQNREQEARWQS